MPDAMVRSDKLIVVVVLGRMHSDWREIFNFVPWIVQLILVATCIRVLSARLRNERCDTYCAIRLTFEFDKFSITVWQIRVHLQTHYASLRTSYQYMYIHRTLDIVCVFVLIAKISIISFIETRRFQRSPIKFKAAGDLIFGKLDHIDQNVEKAN